MDLVKYTSIPISESLLKLDPELNRLAVECFECIMRYMGDLPTTPDHNEVKCVYTILMVKYKKHLSLHLLSTVLGKLFKDKFTNGSYSLSSTTRYNYSSFSFVSPNVPSNSFVFSFVHVRIIQKYLNAFIHAYSLEHSFGNKLVTISIHLQRNSYKIFGFHLSSIRH